MPSVAIARIAAQNDGWQRGIVGRHRAGNIHSGVADLGFTAKSVVSSAEMKGQGKWIELPPASYKAIAQGAVILKHGKKTKAALVQQFYDFLYSTQVRPILERNGFILP